MLFFTSTHVGILTKWLRLVINSHRNHGNLSMLNIKQSELPKFPKRELLKAMCMRLVGNGFGHFWKLTAKHVFINFCKKTAPLFFWLLTSAYLYGTTSFDHILFCDSSDAFTNYSSNYLAHTGWGNLTIALVKWNKVTDYAKLNGQQINKFCAQSSCECTNRLT